MKIRPLGEHEHPFEHGVILLGDHADTVEAETWPIHLDAIRHEELDAVAADFDIVIPADHLTKAPLLKAGTRAAYLVHDLDALERLRALEETGEIKGPILFAPTPVARLELHRLARPTLKAARPIPHGKVLEDADIAEEKGGPGICASLKDNVIGKKALYDLGAGAALDFGVVDEDDWRKP
ncbi:SAF domain-containing protein [Nisaea sp.]|uniref:SAF domain-containing protein n=1 Tax=Nisaea sp. TaxID=2024842 RepID=UPI003B521971